MKFLISILCAILFAIVGTTADAQAYSLTNNAPVPVNGITLQTSCGAIGPINLAPGMTVNLTLAPTCAVAGIVFRGAFFGIGYNGPVPPPLPPAGVTVTLTGVTFW